MKSEVQGTVSQETSRDGKLAYKAIKRTRSTKAKDNLKSTVTGSTTSKRTGRKRPTDELDEEPPAKRARTKAGSAEKGPSECELRKAKWEEWCREREWKPQDDPEYKQKVGGEEVHRSDAQKYFLLKDFEIDTLPYVTFEINHPNRGSQGRSYSLENLRALVSRKFAVVKGVDDEVNPLTEQKEFLKRGWALWEKRLHELEEAAKKNKRNKGKPRPPLVKWRIVERYPSSTRRYKARPPGSWTTPVYENGKLIGWWLNFHFDPYAAEYEEFYASFEQFRPVGADWDWGYGSNNPG